MDKVHFSTGKDDWGTPAGSFRCTQQRIWFYIGSMRR